jgi:transposase
LIPDALGTEHNFSLPIGRFPTPDHLYAATGLAPTTYKSASLTRRGRISRQGLPEHRGLALRRTGPSSIEGEKRPS